MWVSNLLGYDYEIVYRKETTDLAADPLSWQFEANSTVMAISQPIGLWLDKLKRECEEQEEWEETTELRHVIEALQKPFKKKKIEALQNDPTLHCKYMILEGELRY